MNINFKISGYYKIVKTNLGNQLVCDCFYLLQLFPFKLVFYWPK